MGRSETFDHTADLGLRVFADNLPDLFQTAAEGLLDVIVANRDKVEPQVTEHVALTADSTESLLVDWLNELIFRCETRHSLYSRFAVEIAPDGLGMEAQILGEPVDHTRHVLDHEVKSVTRHAVMLVRDGTGWKAELVLDI
jgi:SHS2 domain-containing protein